METFGQRILELREKLGLKHQDMAKNISFTPAILSRYEKNMIRPPYGDQLERLLLALDVQKDSHLWFELSDLADIQRGELPKTIDKLTNPELFQKIFDLYVEVFASLEGTLKKSRIKRIEEWLNDRKIPKEVVFNFVAIDKIWAVLADYRKYGLETEK